MRFVRAPLWVLGSIKLCRPERRLRLSLFKDVAVWGRPGALGVSTFQQIREQQVHIRHLLDQFRINQNWVR